MQEILAYSLVVIATIYLVSLFVPKKTKTSNCDSNCGCH